MSTDVQPSQTPASISPTPPPRSSSWHPSSLFPKHKRSKTPPPAALTTQSERRHRRRSSSLGKALAKLKPSNRDEKGGTLRDGRGSFEGFEAIEAESIVGRDFSVPYRSVLANGQATAPVDEGQGAIYILRQNFDQPPLASPSAPDSHILDQSQEKRTNTFSTFQGYPRDVYARSAPQKGRFCDDRILHVGSPTQEALSQPIFVPEPTIDTERNDKPASEGYHTDEPQARATEIRDILALDFPVVDRVHGHTRRTYEFAKNYAVRANDADLSDRNIEHSVVSNRASIETKETRTAGPSEHGSGRGTGLRKLIGSWGRKTNREEMSVSPEIDRLKKPLPALPVMAQEDLGFHIPALNFSEEKQVTTAQQAFEDKKFRRQQRRSLKESGDYLGVQGANPRTGYWDVSSGSEPSQISEETRRKLDEDAMEVAKRKRRYEEAEEKHRAELQRVQTVRENKKHMEKKMKQRRRGKWQLSENGWSSVAEPDLSPIIQSKVGTPVAELSPEDRLFPMPTAAEPAPYVNQNAIKERDYFGHRPVSSPLKKEHRSTEASSAHSIPRKPVGSPIAGSAMRRKDNESTDTTIHNPIFPTPVRPAPAKVSIDDPQKPHIGLGISLGGGNASPKPAMLSSPRSPSQRLESFLERAAKMGESEEPQENRASVISFQSVSTKQVHIHQPSAQNQRSPSRQARIITCLNELPPVILKDPFTASIPSNLLVKDAFHVWMPPTISQTEPDQPLSSTSMSITTTTGSDLHPHLPAQLDGQDTNEDRAKVPSFQHKPSRLPLRVDSFQDTRQKQEPSRSCQNQTADTVISSVHHLSETKERTASLCQMVSPEGEKVDLKNTPISISTSLSPIKEKQAARNAAQMAFQHLKHTMPVRKAEGQKMDQLTPPMTRKSKEEVGRAAPGGREGTESPSRTVIGKQDIFKRQLPSPNRKNPESGDKLTVRHPHPAAPKADNAGNSKAAAVRAVVLHQADTINSPAKGAGKHLQAARVTQLSVDKALLGLLHDAWLFVEPVFNPDSDVRKRFDRQALTGQDKGLFVVAAFFCAAVFVGSLVFLRVLGSVVQALRAFGGVLRAVIGV
ncbi:hypothetical protein WAI453_009055 [Rhynchosporium graminicola]